MTTTDNIPKMVAQDESDHLMLSAALNCELSHEVLLTAMHSLRFNPDQSVSQAIASAMDEWDV